MLKYLHKVNSCMLLTEAGEIPGLFLSNRESDCFQKVGRRAACRWKISEAVFTS